MGVKTKIEWCDSTWNPLIGCSRVSEGCRNCYAEGIAGRFGNGAKTVYSGLTQIVNGRAVWSGKITETKKLLDPLKWRTPKRVFVNSMSDLFHENVTDEMRDRIFAVMALTPQHTYQVLTKRPERMRNYIASLAAIPRSVGCNGVNVRIGCEGGWTLPNVWLGVSVENQATADERIPLLLKTPAAVRFISAEPLLGPVSLRWTNSTPFGVAHPRHLKPLPDAKGRISTDQYDGLRELDWVICGGESGHGARPMHPDWARALRDQCAAAGVAYFFKQWGAWLPEEQGCAPDIRSLRAEIDGVNRARVGKKAAGALLDGREHKEFPEAR